MAQTVHASSAYLVVFGGGTVALSPSLDCPEAATDLLTFPRGLGEGGWGRPSEKLVLLLAGSTESLRGLTGGGGGCGSDTLGLLFFRLSSMSQLVHTVVSERRKMGCLLLVWKTTKDRKEVRHSSVTDMHFRLCNCTPPHTMCIFNDPTEKKDRLPFSGQARTHSILG